MRLLALICLSLTTGAIAQPKQAPQARKLWMMHGLSLDGKRALLQELSMQGGGDLHYKVVEVDTNKVLEDVSFPGLSNLPIETLLDSGGVKPGSTPNLADPQIIKDLEAVGKIAQGFPLGAANRIAVSPDGKTVAFNVGDQIATASVTKGATKINAQLSKDASYGAWFPPDNKSILFRKWNGKVPGDIVGKYELFASPIGGGAPVRIDNTAGVFDTFTLTKDQKNVRFMVSSEPGIQTCFVEVSLTAPYKATKKACLAGKETVVHCRLSPSATWAACTTVAHSKDGNFKNDKFRFRTLEIDSNKVVYDSSKEILSAAAISDDGVVLVDRYNKTIFLDSKSKAITDLDQPITMGSFPVFRDANHLVIERDGNVLVIDLTKYQHVKHVKD